MKLSGYQCLAAASLSLAACVTYAATRPRTGGTLRVEMQTRLSSMEARPTADQIGLDGRRQLTALLYDRLVSLDGNNQPQPALAVAWESDARFVKWRFRLRTGVKWHDGALLNPADVVVALAGAAPRLHFRLDGDALEITSDESAPDLLLDLATSADFAIQRPSPDSPGGAIVGTGPFRLTEWQPERRAVFQANEDYWGGRPYLDRIEVEMGRTNRDQLIDLELGRADLVQMDPGQARRAQQEGKRIWTSAPLELLALSFAIDNPRVQDARLREAVARSIDRMAILKVLFQNFGEAAGGLFPQWLSGYAFLFPVAADLARARQLKADIGTNPTLRLGYDATDLLGRQVAERVAVDAREAGFSLQPAPLPSGRTLKAEGGFDLILARLRLDGPTLQRAAMDLNRRLPFLDVNPDEPRTVYAAEKRLLDSFTVVPIVCVPEVIGLGPRVRNWNATRWGKWRLDEVWLDAEKP